MARSKRRYAKRTKSGNRSVTTYKPFSSKNTKTKVSTKKKVVNYRPKFGKNKGRTMRLEITTTKRLIR